MKTQLITNRLWPDLPNNVTLNPIINIDDNMDKYDLIILDLNHSEIWQSQDTHNTFKYYEELSKFRINRGIDGDRKLIVLLPQNFLVKSFDKIERLSDKDGGIWFVEQLSLIFGYEIHPIIYQGSFEVNNMLLSSDFVLDYVGYGDAMFSEAIEGWLTTETGFNGEIVATTQKSGNGIITTTLNIKTWKQLYAMLVKFGLTKNDEVSPPWFDDIRMFDDAKQTEIIIEAEHEIKRIQNKIEKATLKLGENNRYKSVLYTNGQNLVDVVFDMLEEMLSIDIDSFEDIKKEDISFEIDSDVFIGEIKGINDNVKTSRLSQLDNHYYHFLEKNDVSENNVYKLLIINHQRNKSLSDRIPIDQKQIKLAKEKFGSLIIETTELLKSYDGFTKGEIDREDIISKFKKTGLYQGL